MALTSIWGDWSNSDPEPNFYYDTPAPTPTLPGGPGGSGHQSGKGYEDWYYNTLYNSLPSVIAAQSGNSPGNMLYNQLHPQQGPQGPPEFVTAEQQNSQARYAEVMRELNKINGLGPDIFTGDIGSYIRQILGSLPMTPEITNRIASIQNQFKAIKDAGVNVLPSGSQGPGGGGGHAPIITLNPNTNNWDFMKGYSPSELNAPGGSSLADAKNNSKPFSITPAFTNLFTQLNGQSGPNPLATGNGNGTPNTPPPGGGNNTPPPEDTTPDGFADFLQMMRNGTTGLSPWQRYSMGLDNFLSPYLAPMFRNAASKASDEGFMRQYYDALNNIRGSRGMPTFWDLMNNANLQANNATAPNQGWYLDNDFTNAPYLPTADPGMFKYDWVDSDGASGPDPGGWGLAGNMQGLNYQKLQEMAGMLNSRSDFRNKMLAGPLADFFSRNNGNYTPISQTAFDLGMIDQRFGGYNSAINEYVLGQLGANHQLSQMYNNLDLTDQNAVQQFYTMMDPYRTQYKLPTWGNLLYNPQAKANSVDPFAGTPLQGTTQPYTPSMAAPNGFQWQWTDPDGETGANPGAFGLNFTGAMPTNIAGATQLANIMNSPEYKGVHFGGPTSLNQMFTGGQNGTPFGVNNSFFKTAPLPDTTPPPSGYNPNVSGNSGSPHMFGINNDPSAGSNTNPLTPPQKAWGSGFNNITYQRKPGATANSNWLGFGNKSFTN